MVTRMTIRIRTQKNPNRFQSQSFSLSPFPFFPFCLFLSLSFFFSFPPGCLSFSLFFLWRHRNPFVCFFSLLSSAKPLLLFSLATPPKIPLFSLLFAEALTFLLRKWHPYPISSRTRALHHPPHRGNTLISLSHAVPISTPASLSSALCVGHQ
jgi:hypothetical protein